MSSTQSTTIQETIRVITRIRPPTEEERDDSNCLQVFSDGQTLLVNTIGPNNLSNSIKYPATSSSSSQQQSTRTPRPAQQNQGLRQKSFSAKKSKTPNRSLASYKTESKTPSRVRHLTNAASSSATPKGPSSVTRLFTPTHRREAIQDVTTDFLAILTPSSTAKSTRRRSRRISFLPSTPSRLLSNEDDTLSRVMNTSSRLSEQLKEEQQSKEKERERAVPKAFHFDRVYDEKTTQSQMFEEVEPFVLSAIGGYNSTVFVYGQTGAGKTFTMSGTPEQPGIIPQTVRLIFDSISTSTELEGFAIYLTYVELHMDQFFDLLDVDSLKNRKNNSASKRIEVHYDPKTKKTFLSSNVVGVNASLKTHVTSYEHTMQLIERGMTMRSVAATKLNDHSSRSHAILTFTIETKTKTSVFRQAKLHLVDLAGSERLNRSGVEGSALRETLNINSSLTALADVLCALSTTTPSTSSSSSSSSSSSGVPTGLVPYRNSKLTFLLQDSLGGNSRTLMIVNVRSGQSHWRETVMSLSYGVRASKINQVASASISCLNEASSTSSVTSGASFQLLETLQRQITDLQRSLDEEKARSQNLILSHQQQTGFLQNQLEEKHQSLEKSVKEKEQVQLKDSIRQYQLSSMRLQTFLDVPIVGSSTESAIEGFELLTGSSHCGSWTQHTREMKMLQGKIQSVLDRKKVLAAQRQAQEHLVTCQLLKDEIASLQERSALLQDSIQKIECQRSALQLQVDQLQTELQIAQRNSIGQLNSQQESALQTQEQITALKSQIATLTDSHNEAMLEKKAQQAKILSLEEHIANLQHNCPASSSPIQTASAPSPIQNVSPPSPTQIVSPPSPIQNVSPPSPIQNVSPPSPIQNVSPPSPTQIVSPPSPIAVPVETAASSQENSSPEPFPLQEDEDSQMQIEPALAAEILEDDISKVFSVDQSMEMVDQIIDLSPIVKPSAPPQQQPINKPKATGYTIAPIRVRSQEASRSLQVFDDVKEEKKQQPSKAAPKVIEEDVPAPKKAAAAAPKTASKLSRLADLNDEEITSDNSDDEDFDIKKPISVGDDEEDEEITRPKKKANQGRGRTSTSKATASKKTAAPRKKQTKKTSASNFDRMMDEIDEDFEEENSKPKTKAPSSKASAPRGLSLAASNKDSSSKHISGSKRPSLDALRDIQASDNEDHERSERPKERAKPKTKTIKKKAAPEPIEEDETEDEDEEQEVAPPPAKIRKLQPLSRQIVEMPVKAKSPVLKSKRTIQTSTLSRRQNMASFIQSVTRSNKVLVNKENA